MQWDILAQILGPRRGLALHTELADAAWQWIEGLERLGERSSYRLVLLAVQKGDLDENDE